MKSWRVAAGLIISAAFLIYAFRGQDFAAIQQALTQANYAYLIPAVALYFVGVWARAFRWSVLLRPLVRTSSADVAPIVAVGFMANNVLPLRTGELVRSYALSRRFGVRKTAALATIAIERLFDGLTMLGFILASATVVSLTNELRQVAIIAFVLFAGVLIGFFLLTLGGNFRDRLLQIVLGPLPTPIADRVERMAESFLAGLSILRRKGDLSAVAALSVVAWLFEASMYWTLAHAFGGSLADVVGIPQALLTTGVANLATLIPSSPGYIGPFESGVILVLNGALSAPRELALSYAILVHAALFFPITIWGAVEWWRQQLSLSQIRELNHESPGSETPQVNTEPLAGHIARPHVPRSR
ncbi:MAG: TIGR00374 family protein [Thermomicrobiales bacterium]|nr:MAG: TIGR00374 family protein [Thermomicrobiales bacterium]